jgi:hypothetical protein
MATVADHIEFEGKTSAFRAMIAADVKLRMDSYHRKIAYAAAIRRKLANPRSRKINLRFDRMWYARAVSKAIVNSAAADLASAKSMAKSQEIYDGMFTAHAPDKGDGMDLDG